MTGFGNRISDQSWEITMKSPRKCVACMYCVWVDDGAAGKVLFCENSLTKESRKPVGFLNEEADACEHFSDAGVSVTASGSFKIC
jgi:hypothetical protein